MEFYIREYAQETPSALALGSSQEAINYAHKIEDEIPLGTDPQYIGGSYKIDGEFAEVYEGDAWDDGGNEMELVGY